MSQASTPVCSLVENTDSIKYHGYIVVIQSHDSEWSRCRDGLGSNKAISYSANQVFTSVKNNLTAYRKKLEDNYSDLSNHDKRGNPDNYEQSYKGYLYEPIIFQPYSHADTLSIYLVDDLDPIHGLAAEAQYLTEELFVGFCPTKASLNLGDHSIEVHEFIELFKNPVKGDLISFTKMKLDGLLTLGQGLLTQEAIFLLISDVIDIEKKSFESDLKFSLVDLQG